MISNLVDGSITSHRLADGILLTTENSEGKTTQFALTYDEAVLVVIKLMDNLDAMSRLRILYNYLSVDDIVRMQ